MCARCVAGLPEKSRAQHEKPFVVREADKKITQVKKLNGIVACELSARLPPHTVRINGGYFLRKFRRRQTFFVTLHVACTCALPQQIKETTLASLLISTCHPRKRLARAK